MKNLTVIILTMSIVPLTFAVDSKTNQNLISVNTLNAQDHNSTRSNQGETKAPDKEDGNQNPDSSSVKKGRNPQTGKEINIKKPNTFNAQDHNSTRSNRGTTKAPDKEDDSQNPDSSSTKKRKNPQTGKEINIKNLNK